MSSTAGCHPSVFAPVRDFFFLLLQSQRGTVHCAILFRKLTLALRWQLALNSVVYRTVVPFITSWYNQWSNSCPYSNNCKYFIHRSVQILFVFFLCCLCVVSVMLILSLISGSRHSPQWCSSPECKYVFLNIKQLKSQTHLTISFNSKTSKFIIIEMAATAKWWYNFVFTFTVCMMLCRRKIFQ